MTTGNWDSTQLYTISANFRAFDATPSTSSLNFIISRRNAAGTIGSFGKNIAATLTQDWVTLTHTIPDPKLRLPA